MAKKARGKTKEPIEIRDVTTTELIRLSRGSIKIRTSRFGLLRFRMITIGDLDFLQELIDHSLPAREFVVQLIHHELDTPTLSVETIRSWNEKLIIRVASIWVKRNPELAEYLRENELTIELIKRVITNYMRKQLQYISKHYEVLDGIMNSAYPFVESQALLSALSIGDMVGNCAEIAGAQIIGDMVGNCAEIAGAQSIGDMVGNCAEIAGAQSIGDVVGNCAGIAGAQSIGDMVGNYAGIAGALSIGDMVENCAGIAGAQSIGDMVGNYAGIAGALSIGDMVGNYAGIAGALSIGDMVGNYAGIAGALSIGDVVGNYAGIAGALSIGDMVGNYAGIAGAQSIGDIWTSQISASDLQLATISQYPLKEIALSQISNSDSANLSKSFMDYFSLSSNFQFKEIFNQNTPEFPPFLSEYAARELFVATKFVKSIFIRDDLVAKENEILEAKISIETDDKLQQLLFGLDPELANMWRGAKEALNSSNSDKIRHISISLRELFTQVIHTLAPDEEIKSWSNAPEDFHNGQPKRSTRLRYIFKDISDECLSDLIKKNISFAIESLDFLNKSTHKPKTNLDNMKLKGIMIIIELLISQLIEISHLKDPV